MRRSIRYFATGMLMMTVLLARAQDRSVVGHVVLMEDMPLVHVRVIASRAGDTAYTDSAGFYRIQAKRNDRLTLSGEGIAVRSHRIRADDSICNVAFSLIAVVPDCEQINIGYGAVSKAHKTQAIASIRMEDDYHAYDNIYDLIVAKCPGILRNGNDLIIRGVGTILGSTSPLYILDGVQINDISFLRPADVKRIDVLKDSSAAIYGSRGANGVVIIETRK